MPAPTEGTNTPDQSAPVPVRLGYRPELDGLRAVAILAVLALHISVHGLRGGFLGVDVFFVLSGSLITGLLLEEWDRTADISLRAFYIRRFLRLAPAVVALLAVLWCAVLIFGKHTQLDPRSMGFTTLYTLGYVANWIQAFKLAPWPTPLSHLWSLAVEEQFYLTWPVLLWLGLRCRISRRSLAWCLGLAALGMGLWRFYVFQHGHDISRVTQGTDTRADGLLVGCCVGVLASASAIPAWVSRRSTVVASAFAVLVGMATFDQGAFTIQFGFSLMNFATGLLILALLSGPVPGLTRWLSSPGLVWLGMISYSLYLWHFPAFFLVQRFRHPWEAFDPLFKLLVTFGFALGSYYLVERPFLRLKRKFMV